MQSGVSGRNTILLSIASFVLPFLVIVILNWSVFKTAKSQIDASEVQIGSLAGSESQQQEIAKRMKERKAAADITIIICAFVMCFLPFTLLVIFASSSKTSKFLPKWFWSRLVSSHPAQYVTRSSIPSAKENWT